MLSLRVKAAPTPSFYPLSLITSSFVPVFEPSIQSSSFAPFTVAPCLRLSSDSWLYYDYDWYYERVNLSSWLSRDFIYWLSPLTTRGDSTAFKYWYVSCCAWIFQTDLGVRDPNRIPFTLPPKQFISTHFALELSLSFRYFRCLCLCKYFSLSRSDAGADVFLNLQTLIKSINPFCHPHFRVKDQATVSKSPIVVSPPLPFHASLRYPPNIRPHPNKNTSYTSMMLVFLFELELISHV